jgi:hypothetical protein
MSLELLLPRALSNLATFHRRQHTFARIATIYSAGGLG